MRTDELGENLKDIYDTAPQGYKVTHIHLFGIKYGNEIIRDHFSIADIVQASGINESYKTEVAKGVKFSSYVKAIV